MFAPCEPWKDSHAFQAQHAGSVGQSPLKMIFCSKDIIWNRLSARTVHWSPELSLFAILVPSQLMNSKGVEIFYWVNDDRDRKWAWRLEWVVKQHLYRPGGKDELDQLQQFGAALRQCKDARERKYDQEHIADLYKQLETAHMTLGLCGGDHLVE
jgi:hypothetical protein